MDVTKDGGMPAEQGRPEIGVGEVQRLPALVSQGRADRVGERFQEDQGARPLVLTGGNGLTALDRDPGGIRRKQPQGMQGRQPGRQPVMPRGYSFRPLKPQEGLAGTSRCFPRPLPSG